MRKSKNPLLDIIICLAKFNSWIMLSRYDIVSQYRRTKLGPMWVVISAALSLGIMSAVWTIIFNLEWRVYLPYMILGFIVWSWVIDHITMASDIYVSTFASSLRSTPHPPLLYNFRYVASRFFYYAHYLPLIIVLLAATSTIPQFPDVLLLVPAIFMILLNGFCATVIIGFLNARFRDIGQLVQALMMPMMLLTPVMWTRSMLGEYSWLVNLNPFAHFIDIVRSPLIGTPTPDYAWIAVLSITCLHVMLALWTYRKYRNFLVLWI